MKLRKKFTYYSNIWTNYFDPTIQQTYPCYDQCLKITVYPSRCLLIFCFIWQKLIVQLFEIDFIVRTCTTLLSSLTTPINLTVANPQAQQCYAGTYTDPLSSLPQPAYFCYCNDNSGCNNSLKLVFDCFVLILFLFVYFGHSFLNLK